MNRGHRFVVALAFTFSASGTAVASPSQLVSGSRALALPRSSAVRESQFVLAPMAFIVFCRTYPGECADGPAQAITMDGHRWSTIQEVNRRVNRSIRPVADRRGDDHWEVGTATGDCDEYALEKRRQLVAQGFPAGSLALAVALTLRGEHHLVTLVRTDRGDFVLDNLRDDVRPWGASGHRFLMLQSSKNLRYWVGVGAG